MTDLTERLKRAIAPKYNSICAATAQGGIREESLRLKPLHEVLVECVDNLENVWFRDRQDEIDIVWDEVHSVLKKLEAALKEMGV